MLAGHIFAGNDDNSVFVRWFNKWFNREVEPINKLLAEGVEVYGKTEHPLEPIDFWSHNFEGTHKALLINIEPIKQGFADAQSDAAKEIERLRAAIQQARHESSWPLVKAILDRALKGGEG